MKSLLLLLLLLLEHVLGASTLNSVTAAIAAASVAAAAVVGNDGCVSGTKKAPKLNFWGKVGRQKSLLKFWPMGGQKKV